MLVLLLVLAVVATGCGSASGQSGVDRRTSTTRKTTTTPTTSRASTTTTTAAIGNVDPPSTSTGPSGAASVAVDRLVVAAPALDLAPYRRKAFGNGWDYDPASKCNTRERVLIAESLVPATVDDKCHPQRGQWRSAYDGVTTTNPADVEIDHLVPLADVWRAGGAAWPADRREAYANDLTDPNTLLAVTTRTNRSKSDSTPDQWLPPDRMEWCTYATAWVEVKARWQLTVTAPEKATLVQVLQGC